MTSEDRRVPEVSIVSFWLNVGLCYLMLLGLGLAAGAYFGSRGRRDGRGYGDGPAPSPVLPLGPTYGIEWLPLGSPFDRALLPAAFADDDAIAPV